MAADIGHKELDSQNRNDECDDRADGEDDKLLTREGVAFREEIEKLYSASARHRGDGEEEGKLCACGAAAAEKHRAQNGRSASGGSGDERETLHKADKQRGFIGEVARFEYALLFLHLFDDDKENTVDNQRRADDVCTAVARQHSVDLVVKGESQNCGRDARNQYLEPQNEAVDVDVVITPFLEGARFFAVLQRVSEPEIPCGYSGQDFKRGNLPLDPQSRA